MSAKPIPSRIKEVEENGLNLYLQEMWYVKKRTEAIRTIALKEKTTLFTVFKTF